MQSSENIRWLYKTGFAIFSVGLILLAIIPTEFLESLPPVCLFKNLFGVECFGCGMTRAISVALHGEFVEALRYNKFVVLILPLSILLFFFHFTRFLLIKPKQVLQPKH